MKIQHARWFRVVPVLILAAIALFIPQATSTQAQIGGTISYGSIVFGTVPPSTLTLTYSFSGNKDDLVTVDIWGMTGGIDPFADLLAPGNQTLFSNNDDRYISGTKSVHFSIFLPVTGTYSLLVTDANKIGGDFLLSLQGRPLVTRTPLVFGTPVTVNIPLNAPSQYYRFDAAKCPTTLTVIDLAAGLPFTFPFVVRVRSEQGQAIALLRGGQVTENRVTVAPLSGWYEVEVLSDDPAVNGSVSLLVGCAEDCGTGTGGRCPQINLTSRIDNVTNRTVTLFWNRVTNADYYEFQIYGTGAGGEVFITAEGGGTGTSKTFTLPAGYTHFRFVLTAMKNKEPICTAEISVDFSQSQQGVCGNGVIESGEQCDPPNTTNCTAQCQNFTPTGGYCGDGVVDPGLSEQCDPPNTTNCTAQCQNFTPTGGYCGDGVVDPGLGEQCDPPNTTNCTAQCQNFTPTGGYCGDGVVDPGLGEQCDPPNTTNCTAQCQNFTPTGYCGDGFVDPNLGEQCDPPNTTNCTAQCQNFTPTGYCGDGFVDPNLGEQCDPPNTTNCTAQCQSFTPKGYCGDGIVDPSLGEQCDPPNVTDCTAQCQIYKPYCGNGIIDPGEECEPPDGLHCTWPEDPAGGCRVIPG